MLDEYRALVAILRRPMRRWWLSVGIWWLAMLAVIGIYQCWHSLEITPVWLQNLGSTSYTLPFEVLQRTTYILGVVIEMVLWLAAATVVNATIQRMQGIQVTPITTRLPAYRFFLFMSQGIWIVLLSATLYEAGDWCSGIAYRSVYPDAPTIFWPAYMNSFLGILVGKALVFSWIAALLASYVTRPVVTWLWAIPFCISSYVRAHLMWLYHLLVPVTSTTGPSLSMRNLDISYIWILGLLLLFVMIDGFRCRKLFLGYLAYCALLLSRLTVIAIAFLQGNILLDRFGTVGLMAANAISNWADGVYFIPAVAAPSCLLIEESTMGQLGINLPPLSFAFNIPDWMIILAPLINMLWVLLIWFVLTRFVLVRRHELD